MKEDKIIYKLSDAFADKQIESGCEWTTTVFNINKGRNPNIMNACKALSDYSYFVSKVREYNTKKIGLKEAIDLAVENCIDNNIMSDFLRTHKAEVASMAYTEYKEIEERKLVRDEAFGEGFDEGFDEGRASMMIETVIKFVKKQNISEEEACIMLDYDLEQYLKYKSVLAKME